MILSDTSEGDMETRSKILISVAATASGLPKKFRLFHALLRRGVSVILCEGMTAPYRVAKPLTASAALEWKAIEEEVLDELFS